MGELWVIYFFVCFCRNPERCDERPIVGNMEHLLCEHKKFMYPIDLVEKLQNDMRDYASSPEADRIDV